MASNSTTSNYTQRIDVTFPVAGKDNDSQGFRTNFSNIQNALYSADADIQNLFRSSVLNTTSTNFHSNIISNAIFQNCSDKIYDVSADAQSGTINIDVSLGGYQKYKLSAGTTTFTTINWPTTSVGAIILCLIPDSPGSVIATFNPSLTAIGETTAFPETLLSTSFYKIWSDNGGDTVYITKLGNSITTVATATVVNALQTLKIGSNTYTTGTGFSTVVAGGGYYADMAFLPNRVPASITIASSNQPTNSSIFTVAENKGIYVGATTRLLNSSTQFTVTAVSGTNVTVTPAADLTYIPSYPYSVTFTNLKFTGSYLATYNSTTPSSLVGALGDYKGQINASSTTLYVSYDDYNTGNIYFKVSADSVVRELVTGTTVSTATTLTDSSKIIANTGWVQNVVATAVYGGLEGALPPGIITLWYGSIADVPDGWALCDGGIYNGYVTPDLRNKFVIGAHSDNGLSTATTTVTGSQTFTGGSAHSTLIEHTHAAASVVSDPGHIHLSQYDGRTPSGIDYAGSGSEIGGMGAGYTYPTSSTATGITVTTALLNAGSTDGTNQNLPPYYALAYIMKVV